MPKKRPTPPNQDAADLLRATTATPTQQGAAKEPAPRFYILLDRDLKLRADIAARRNGTTLSKIIRKALEDYAAANGEPPRKP